MVQDILKQGETIAGDYAVKRRVSGGALSQSYVIVDRTHPSLEFILKLNVPLEELDPRDVSAGVYHFCQMKSHIERTEDEVQALTHLNHPHIMKINRVVDIHNKRYKGIISNWIKHPRTLREVITDYNQGGHYFLDQSQDDLTYTLRTETGNSSVTVGPIEGTTEDKTFNFNPSLKGKKKFEKMFEVFLTFMRAYPQALESVLYLNGSGFVGQGFAHKDIKPENIVLDQEGNCYLVDFGLCSRFEEQRGIQGSSLYSPPECYAGIFGDADLFNLGLSFYELLSGEHVISKTKDPRANKKEISRKLKKLGLLKEQRKYYKSLEEEFGNLQRYYHLLQEGGEMQYGKMAYHDDYAGSVRDYFYKFFFEQRGSSGIVEETLQTFDKLLVYLGISLTIRNRRMNISQVFDGREKNTFGSQIELFEWPFHHSESNSFIPQDLSPAEVFSWYQGWVGKQMESKTFLYKDILEVRENDHWWGSFTSFDDPSFF